MQVSVGCAEATAQPIQPLSGMRDSCTHCLCNIVLPAGRAAQTDEELQACATLRASAFYVYPPERAFAGQVRIHHAASAALAMAFRGNCQTSRPHHLLMSGGQAAGEGDGMGP